MERGEGKPRLPLDAISCHCYTVRNASWWFCKESQETLSYSSKKTLHSFLLWSWNICKKYELNSSRKTIFIEEVKLLQFVNIYLAANSNRDGLAIVAADFFPAERLNRILSNWIAYTACSKSIWHISVGHRSMSRGATVVWVSCFREENMPFSLQPILVAMAF